MANKVALNVSVKNKSCSYSERGLYLDRKCTLELCNFSASFTFTVELSRALGNGNVSVPEKFGYDVSIGSNANRLYRLSERRKGDISSHPLPNSQSFSRLTSVKLSRGSITFICEPKTKNTHKKKRLQRRLRLSWRRANHPAVTLRFLCLKHDKKFRKYNLA